MANFRRAQYGSAFPSLHEGNWQKSGCGQRPVRHRVASGLADSGREHECHSNVAMAREGGEENGVASSPCSVEPEQSLSMLCYVARTDIRKPCEALDSSDQKDLGSQSPVCRLLEVSVQLALSCFEDKCSQIYRYFS